MSKLAELLKKKGYKIFGNKDLSDRPIIIVDEKWLEEAEKCDREGVLEQLINYANAKLNRV
jgi:hypothetical protein